MEMKKLKLLKSKVSFLVLLILKFLLNRDKVLKVVKKFFLKLESAPSTTWEINGMMTENSKVKLECS